MPPRRLLPVTLAALAVLAGCTSGPAATPATTPSTASPTSTSTTGPPTFDSATDLPGVTNGTLRNPGALLAANARALAGGAYVAERNWTYRFRGIDRRNRSRVTTVRVDGADWRVHETGRYHDDGTEPYFRGDAWSNGTVASYRRQSDGETRFLPADVTHSPNETIAADFVGQWLARGTFVHRTTRQLDAGTRYVFVADGDGIRGRLVVDARGRIRSLTVAFAAEDGAVAVRFRYALDPRGSVAVERPAWLEAARQAGAVVPCTDDTDDVECTDRGDR